MNLGNMLRQINQTQKITCAGWCWPMPLIPALRRQRQADVCEFEASLVYRVVTLDSVLPPRYSSRATVPSASWARAWRLKEHTRDHGHSKGDQPNAVYSTLGKSYYTWLLHKEFRPGRWEITIPKMKQCPTANHQVTQKQCFS